MGNSGDPVVRSILGSVDCRPAFCPALSLASDPYGTSRPPMPGGMASGRGGDGLGQRWMRLWRDDVVTDSAFELRRQTQLGGLHSVWSRGAKSHFAGREGDLALDGQVNTCTRSVAG